MNQKTVMIGGKASQVRPLVRSKEKTMVTRLVIQSMASKSARLEALVFLKLIYSEFFLCSAKLQIEVTDQLL